jgi:2-keto-3-deoxy-L-fuconate dehydrogenase
MTVTARFGDLVGQRVLVTSAGEFMGPAVVDAFGDAGCDVVADDRYLVDPAAPAAAVAEATVDRPLDVVVANLGVHNEQGPATAITDDAWQRMFDHMVHPLMRLVRAALPAMIERGRGKIVVLGSSASLRPIRGSTAYATARGAQLTFVTNVGTEVARHNVQVNAIAQNYIANSMYYPPELVATERFQTHLSRNVPANRLGRPEDTTQLALFLASGASDFIAGRILPLDGGWSA